MSSAGFGKRRGLREVVARGERVGEHVTLTLACGHTVQRNWRSDCKSAVCRDCVKVDGAKRDAANKAAGR